MTTVGTVKPEVRRARDEKGHVLRWADLEDARIERSTRADGTEVATFHGEAIVFNEWTWIGSQKYGFRERIAPEAVTDALVEDDVRFLINHDPNLILGRNTAGTVDLRATERSLEVDSELPALSYAQDLAISLERGDVSGMSFAFEILEESVAVEEDGTYSYTITKLRLYDVSVVTYPAYTMTTAGLRSEALEVLCRSAGLSQVEERKLLRSLTSAPDEAIDEAVLAEMRGIVTSTDTATGEEPVERDQEPGTGGGPAGSERRAGGAPDDNLEPDGHEEGEIRNEDLEQRTLEAGTALRTP